MKEIFTQHYETNHWGSLESASGVGSEVGNTKTLREGLKRVLQEYEISTILDIPCGDWNWMKEFNLDRYTYIGADIVDSLIKENNRSYAKDNVSFSVLDISKDNLPTVDIIFVRDCLFHFSNNDIKKAINNIKRSGSKFLLTTSFVNAQHASPTNIDINTGEWRFINLELEPYNFPAPLDRIMEFPTIESEFAKDKSMALWLIDDLPNYILDK